MPCCLSGLLRCWCTPLGGVGTFSHPILTGGAQADPARNPSAHALSLPSRASVAVTWRDCPGKVSHCPCRLLTLPPWARGHKPRKGALSDVSPAWPFVSAQPRIQKMGAEMSSPPALCTREPALPGVDSQSLAKAPDSPPQPGHHLVWAPQTKPSPQDKCQDTPAASLLLPSAHLLVLSLRVWVDQMPWPQVMTVPDLWWARPPSPGYGRCRGHAWLLTVAG